MYAVLVYQYGARAMYRFAAITVAGLLCLRIVGVALARCCCSGGTSGDAPRDANEADSLMDVSAAGGRADKAAYGTI